VSAALAVPHAPPATWRELSARGASVEVFPGPVVAVRAPADVAADLRAALAWRIEAMRAQVKARARIGGAPATPVAVPGLALPLGPVHRWRGPRESFGRTTWVTLEAQRSLPGLCPSCGEAQAPGGTGDCALCNAARVGALRAEGALGAPVAFEPPPPVDEVAWRAAHYAAVARPDPLPPPPSRAPWTCDACGAWNVGRRDVEGCGRCELKAADVLSMAKLGGGAAADEDGEGDE